MRNYPVDKIDINKEAAVFFTGHRPIELWNAYRPFSAANERFNMHRMLTLEAIDKCISSGYNTFISGGAQGFDLLAAECVHEKRIQYPYIKLVIARPFPGQHANKPEKSKSFINNIMSLANAVVDVSPDPYNAQKMQLRNMWMVDNAKIGIALYNSKQKGGTFNCIEYARKQGKFILVIDSQNFTYYVINR